MGAEFAAKGANVQLGPGMNVMRTPYCGRTFEYVSGEDPVLGAVMATAVVTGIQSAGVMATPKHFIDNSQELDRVGVEEIVDGRTQRQLYMPPFAAAAKAGAHAFMCSYNKINGPWACEDPDTLTGLLRKEAGYSGYVMSDWGATHSTAPALKAGLDVEMGAANFYRVGKLAAAIEAGSMTNATVDTACERVVEAMIRQGLMEPDTPSAHGDVLANVTTDAHAALAREIAAKSAILLKNRFGALPLGASGDKKIAVVGDAARDAPIVVGDGSGRVQPPYISTHYDAIAGRVAKGATTYTPSNTKEAGVAAAAADIAIVVVGVHSGEGHDRSTLGLSADDDALVTAVVAAQPRTVVVVCAPGPVVMPWRDDVDGILFTMYGGQEAGNGVADVLFGTVPPTARLPFTIPGHENETAWSPSQYPGINTSTGYVATYSERMETGYRAYHRSWAAEPKGGEVASRALKGDLQPAFYFGYGLGYTQFDYGNVSVNGRTVGTTISNVGQARGCELAQLYVTWPKAGLGGDEPPAQLRGFDRQCIDAGATVAVSFTITDDDLQLYDEKAAAWVVPSGDYRVSVARCAGCLDQSATLKVPKKGIRGVAGGPRRAGSQYE